MPKVIPVAVRRQIVAFDPAVSEMTVVEFCRRLGVSRRSFYTIRQQFAESSSAALQPRSSAPVHPRRVYGDQTRQMVVALRQQLEAQGCDAGPVSVRLVGMQQGVFVQGMVPSVSTIARMLRDAGMVRRNPRKRPKGPVVRFARTYAMELWQLDAFEFPLFTAPGCQGGQRVCIYQLIDDATRFDVGTRCFPRPENQHDAMIVVTQAIADYGAPQELLSDNSTAFHQLRRGLVGPLEVFLASQGCMPIASTPGHPTTQGKVERSHQTLQHFLTVREPTTIADVERLLVIYRDLYNHRRAHQALSKTTPITPGQAWELIEHVPATEPIDPAVLEYRASQYAQRHPKRPTKQPPPLPQRPPEPDNQPGQPPMELVFVTHKSRYAYYRSYHIGLPSSHANRYYYRQITPTEYRLWDPNTGELVMSFPLPLVALPPNGQFIPSYAIKGIKLHNAPNLWTQRKLNNQLGVLANAIQLD